jgi:hypothetical protein
MAGLEYLMENATKLQRGDAPLKVRSTWISAMAPGRMFGRPHRFNTNGTIMEEQALVRLAASHRVHPHSACALEFEMPLIVAFYILFELRDVA